MLSAREEGKRERKKTPDARKARKGVKPRGKVGDVLHERSIMQPSIEPRGEDGQGEIGQVAELLGLGPCRARIGGYVKGPLDLPALNNRLAIRCADGGQIEVLGRLG